MKVLLALGLAFVVGLVLGFYFSRPLTVHAQGSQVTVTPVQATWVGSHKPESLTVPGEVVGFGCGQHGCYILSR